MNTFTRTSCMLLAGVASAVLPVAFASAVSAQTPAPPVEAAPANPNTNSGEQPKDAEPDSENLSKKLNKNDGVLKPPSGIDPEMHKSTPEGTGDKMPVIIPPGEPGGDQSVQPK